MHNILLGRPAESELPQFVTGIMAHPESAWTVNVTVPNNPVMYGPLSGTTFPVMTYITFPARPEAGQKDYGFPYQDSSGGIFENMLAPGKSPVFANPKTRYPLILFAHGSSSHALYGVDHAQDVARHGYVVASIFYGDDRHMASGGNFINAAYLRPLVSQAVIDSLVESKDFGNNIDADNIGVSGHSFGGFTGLALAGGPFLDNPDTVHDPRVKAGVLAAPWVAQMNNGQEIPIFGPSNQGIANVSEPMLWLFGSKDPVIAPSSILNAARQSSGPTYVIELIDQPHIFEGPSWEDRNGWELLFFDAYLKDDASALEKIKNGLSMQGGNEDRHLINYQK